MSSYIYAIIPYKSDISVTQEEPCVYYPILPELKCIESEFTDRESLELYPDFLMINLCYRKSAFTENKDGYSWIRSEICQIARALGATEVWYADELAIQEMDDWEFSFENWVVRIKNEKLVVELTQEILKGKEIYGFYHDDFSDIIMERPPKMKYKKFADGWRKVLCDE